MTSLKALYQIPLELQKALCYIFKYRTVLLKTSRSNNFNVLNWWSYPLMTHGRRDYTQENSAVASSCVCGPWAAVLLQLVYYLLHPLSVYCHLRAFGSLCHRFTFYLCLIWAVTFTAYPPVIAFLQPRWQRNYSYSRFNWPCSFWATAEF